MKLIKLIKKHAFPAFLVSVIDFLFVLALTKVHFDIFEKTTAIFNIVNQELQQQTADFVSAPTITALQYSNALMAAYRDLIKYAILMFVSAFLIYTFFQGINFTILAKKLKKPIKQFIKQFIIINFIWFTILILIIICSVLLASTTFTPLPIFSEKNIAVIIAFLTLILSYFALTSYGTIPTKHYIKESFKTPIKHFKKLAPLFAVITAIMVLLFYLIAKSFAISFVVFLAYVLFIFFPAAYIARYLYLKKVVTVTKKS